MAGDGEYTDTYSDSFDTITDRYGLNFYQFTSGMCLMSLLTHLKVVSAVSEKVNTKYSSVWNLAYLSNDVPYIPGYFGGGGLQGEISLCGSPSAVDGVYTFLGIGTGFGDNHARQVIRLARTTSNLIYENAYSIWLHLQYWYPDPTLE